MTPDTARTSGARAEFSPLDLIDPRRIVRWIYVGRLTLAAAIFLAAVFAWLQASRVNTLIASLTFASAMVFTVASALWSEVWHRPLGRTFLYLQGVVDVLLVTAIVHVTGGPSSTFAALYVLVIAVAALVLPIGGAFLIAVLGNVLYVADAIATVEILEQRGVVLQLAVFAIVAVGSALITQRLRRAGSGTQELVAELRTVRLQAAEILRTIESGILTVDARGVLLYVNPAASRLLGIILDQQVGLPVLDVLQRRAPVLADVLQRTARERIRLTRAEGAVVRDHGTVLVGVTTTFSEGAEAPNDVRATAIFQDISDQKRMEALQLRAQRLEAVTTLGASLAHEIKNPLSIIRSAVEQLARRSAADDDERTLAGLITRESDRLARILTEFLDFTRVRAASFALVDVTALARHAVDLTLSHPDRAEGVAIVVHAPEGPLVVAADEDLLHRALFNLLLNAVQSMPGGGQVLVELGRIDAAHLPREVTLRTDHVLVRIADDGPGLPDSVRERIFEPFLTTRMGGTGLGLPIVHRAVEAHRGQILYRSDGTGTRFDLYLPTVQPESGASQ